MRLVKVEVVTPGGNSLQHHVIRLQKVAVTAVLNESDEVLMLKRHRFVTDQVGWELPQGIVDPGEAAEAAAEREVLEETGWKVGPIKFLLEYQPMIGMVDTPHVLFIANEAEQVAEPSDPDETGIVRWIPLWQTLKMIHAGEILGSGSIIALLYLLARKGSSPSTT